MTLAEENLRKLSGPPGVLTDLKTEIERITVDLKAAAEALKMQSCTTEQTVAVPIPRVMEEILEAVIPREHVQNHTVEQLVDVPDTQIQE